jgi:chromosome segregation ATPase
MPSGQQMYNEECSFDTILYDLRPVTTAGSVAPSRGRPAHISSRRWEQAESDNPDPQHLEPVLISGVQALKARYDQQQATAAQVRAHLDEVKSHLETLEVGSRRISRTYTDLHSRQTVLRRKFMSVMRKIEVLRCHGVKLDSKEMQYRETLEDLLARIRRPHAKLHELALLHTQQENRREVHTSLTDNEVQALTRDLAHQREGLQLLSDLVRKDARDITIFKKKMAILS